MNLWLGLNFLSKSMLGLWGCSNVPNPRNIEKIRKYHKYIMNSIIESYVHLPLKGGKLKEKSFKIQLQFL